MGISTLLTSALWGAGVSENLPQPSQFFLFYFANKPLAYARRFSWQFKKIITSTTEYSKYMSVDKHTKNLNGLLMRILRLSNFIEHKFSE